MEAKRSMRQLISVSNGKELYHHGILGQKWGVKNGPPYPLGVGDHNAREKKAGWRQSLNTSSDKKDRLNNKKRMSEDTKRKLKKAAIIAGVSVGLIAGGYLAYKMHTRVYPRMNGLVDKRKIEQFNDTVDNLIRENSAKRVKALELYADTSQEAVEAWFLDNGLQFNDKYEMIKKASRSSDSEFYKNLKIKVFDFDESNGALETVRSEISKINEKLSGTPEGSINCAHCSLSFVLNNAFGKNVRALGNYGVDEVSGSIVRGRYLPVYDAMFDNINWISNRNRALYNPSFTSRPFRNLRSAVEDLSIDDFPANSCGIVSVPGHVMNYISNDNRTILIDCQSNKWYDLSNPDTANFVRYFMPIVNILDFSQASIKPNAEAIWRHMIEEI